MSTKTQNLKHHDDLKPQRSFTDSSFQCFCRCLVGDDTIQIFLLQWEPLIFSRKEQRLELTWSCNGHVHGGNVGFWSCRSKQSEDVKEKKKGPTCLSAKDPLSLYSCLNKLQFISFASSGTRQCNVSRLSQGIWERLSLCRTSSRQIYTWVLRRARCKCLPT